MVNSRSIAVLLQSDVAVQGAHVDRANVYVLGVLKYRDG
jgi:hypothetical protein